MMLSLRLAATRNRWLPPLLLLTLVFAALYLAGDGWGGLHQTVGGHDWNTAENMALAENLSPSHNFLMFLRQSPGPDVAPVYDPYNRFPIGGFALIKLAILPFGDDLSAKLYAGRMLMLLMFAAAATLAYASLRRITTSRYIALTATLLAFSSYYVLYYSDMVANDVTMDLFAVLLVFHGVTVHEQEKRFRQLLLKTGLALLLGWHVYALLLPVIAFGLGGEIIRAARGNTFPNLAARIRNIAAALLRSRYLRLGLAAFLFGSALLSFNIANEYAALGGETPLMELPSVQSAIKRTGQNPEYNAAAAEHLAWDQFLPEQLRRIGRMSLPYILTFYNRSLGGLPYFAIGIAATAAGLAGLLFLRRHRLPLAALVLCGLCWGLGMRVNTALHDLESVFYIGIPLVLYTLLLLALRRWIGRWRSQGLLAVIAATALVIFVLSAWQHGRTEARQTAPARETMKALMSDFQEIRRLTQGQRVYVTIPEIGPYINPRPQFTSHIISWLLTGNIIRRGEMILPGCGPECVRHYDFVISGDRDFLPTPLTPANRLAFLFDTDVSGVTAEYRAAREAVVSGDYGKPVVQSEFDVYAADDRLIYHKDQCQPQEAESRFSLHVIPYNADNLFQDRQESSFNNLDFDFKYLGAFLDGDCLVIAPLPDYPIASIRTGQYVYGQGERIWSAEFPATIARHRAEYEAIASGDYGDPVARGVFNVYWGETELIYVNETCAAADLEARFRLNLYPGDNSDLPPERQPYGFDNLNFNFRQRGTMQNGRCLAIARLPDYSIKRISTGQYIEGGSQVWQSEINLMPQMQMRRIESGLENPAPVASGLFDIYLDGNKLIYRREPCAPADAAARFFLHVIPVDGDDLSEDRWLAGFDNLDFDFAGRGAISGGKCLAAAPLPDYPIARIRTGQHIPGQGNLWRADFPVGR